MKTKYRIREFIRHNGSRYFIAQRSFFIFFWENMHTRYASYEDALEAIEKYRGMEIVEAKNHNV